MHVRSAPRTDVPPTSPPPVPVPPRWHLRTQVSRKTLFELIQDTLPPARLQVTGAPEGPAIAPDSTPADSAAPAAAEPGVLPQAYLDSLAATVPMSLNPATMWSDGDTTPDVPEHWRPITITLASTPALLPPALPPPPAPGPPRHPLHGVAKTAGWMLSGAALTFLVSAAAFGGKPMLRAIRAVMAPAQTQGAPGGAIPATAPPTPEPLPAGAPTPRLEGDSPVRPTVVAEAQRAEPKAPPALPQLPPVIAADDRGAAGRGPEARQDGDASTAGDRKAGPGSSHGARRSRQDRRLARTAAPADADRAASLPGGDDAVMPLESLAAELRDEVSPATPTLAKPSAVRPPAVAKAPSAIAKSSGARAFRAIDVEDPFGAR